MRIPQVLEVGWEGHSAGVARLRESYAALPPDAPVRLAKRTSNLFRGRAEASAGLDVSGLQGVIEVVGDVAEVQGMCTYEHLVDATLIVYEGARHELFNETNREEVRADLIRWLDERFAVD